MTLPEPESAATDSSATRVMSHGDLGTMLFGLEEPSEDKVPVVQPTDTQELPKWAVDTGMTSEYGLRGPASFGIRSLLVLLISIMVVGVGFSRDLLGFGYSALVGRPLVTTPSDRMEQMLPLFHLEIDVTRFENVYVGSLWVGKVEFSYNGEHPVAPILLRLVGELPDGREWSMPLYPNWTVSNEDLRERPIHELLPPDESLGLSPGQSVTWFGLTPPTTEAPTSMRLEVDFDD